MLFQNVLAAIFAVNSRLIARRFKHATVPLNVVIYLTIAVSGLGYAAIKGFSHVSLATFVHYMGLFFIAGICFAITNMLSYIVFEYVDAGVASLLSTLNIVAAVIFATIAIHEGLTWQQIVGGFILITSMELIVTLKLSHYRHKRLWQAILLSVLASVFFAFATTTEKYLLNHVNLPTYLVFGWGFQFIGVVAMSATLGIFAKTNIHLLREKKFWKFALPASLLRMVSGLLFIFSLKLSNNLSVISVLSGMKVILAALLGAYFLKEKEFLGRKLVAAMLATVAVAIIYWK